MTLGGLSLRTRRHLPTVGWLAGAVAVFAAVALPARRLEESLREPALVTGYALLAVVLALSIFNARKRLSMLPLAAVRIWARAHVIGGVLALALFWLHTGAAWPTGLYEQLLAALFYAVSASGAIGFVLERTYPRRLTQTGIEVVFERIPDEIASLREQAEQTVLECTKEQKADTLARVYVEALHWFFRQPRFLLSHLWGGQRASFWVAQQLDTARRYLSEAEDPYLDRLRNLAHAKARLDLHYAIQGLLKVWLLVHVPAAAALLAVALWHLLLVNIYGL